MKKILLVAVLLISSLTFAQSFAGKGHSIYSISAGAFNYFHFTSKHGKAGNAFGLIGQGEYGVHDYVGVGWQVNLGWNRGSLGVGNGIIAPYSTNKLYTSAGISVNFHFYRLIDDKVDANIFSDQLDIYFGINLNAGVGFGLYKDGANNKQSDIFGIASGGPHLGVGWYPKAGKIGMMAEVGYGKTYASFGAVFKM